MKPIKRVELHFLKHSTSFWFSEKGRKPNHMNAHTQHPVPYSHSLRSHQNFIRAFCQSHFTTIDTFLVSYALPTFCIHTHILFSQTIASDLYFSTINWHQPKAFPITMQGHVGTKKYCRPQQAGCGIWVLYIPSVYWTLYLSFQRFIKQLAWQKGIEIFEVGIPGL